MTKHCRIRSLYIFRQHERTAGKHRLNLSALHERNSRTGRSSVRNIFGNVIFFNRRNSEPSGSMFFLNRTRNRNKRNNILNNLVIADNSIKKRPASFKTFCTQDSFYRHFNSVAACFYNQPFFLNRRIRDNKLKKKTVELSFRQIVRAFLFNRVLRCKHKERLRQMVCLFADRNLMLSHRFKECALHFRRRTVYFVRKNYIGKNRTFAYRKFSRTLLIHERSGNISRKKIRRKLNALEFKAGNLRESLYGKRLCESRHAFKKNMTAGNKRCKNAVYNLGLSYKTLGSLRAA